MLDSLRLILRDADRAEAEACLWPWTKKGANLQTEAFRQVRRQAREPAPFRVLAKEDPLPEAPIHPMIPRPGAVISQGSSHRRESFVQASFVNYLDATPLPYEQGLGISAYGVPASAGPACAGSGGRKWVRRFSHRTNLRRLNRAFEFLFTSNGILGAPRDASLRDRGVSHGYSPSDRINRGPALVPNPHPSAPDLFRCGVRRSALGLGVAVICVGACLRRGIAARRQPRRA